jgi:protein SCO1/2
MKWQKPLLVLAMLAVVLVGFWSYQQGNPPSRPAAPQVGGDFTLMSDHGPVSLKDFRGKVVLLSFGYTSCPDICPTTLGLIGATMKKLSDKERAQVQPMFITIDPERDDAQRMAAYTQHFYPGMLGLSGTPEQIEAVAKQYLVIYRKVPLPDSALGYAMDHSARLYIVGRDGQLNALADHSSTPEDLVAYLRDALNGIKQL